MWGSNDMVGASAVASTTGVAAPDDAVLVAHAKRDPQAFAPLYQRYVDPIYRYCYRRLGEREAAADATAQVFAKALGALPGCRDDRFRSWLFSIAHNVLVDAYRARRGDAPLDAADEVVDAAPSPEDLALAADDRRTMVRLLDHLTPDQRQVVELRLAGLSAEEIATVLGRSRGSVDTAQCRAIARLRALLGVDVASRKGGTNATR
jgi:RNA polymerase sigma-70 factor (ECF subfamily)